MPEAESKSLGVSRVGDLVRPSLTESSGSKVPLRRLKCVFRFSRIRRGEESHASGLSNKKLLWGIENIATCLREMDNFFAYLSFFYLKKTK